MKVLVDSSIWSLAFRRAPADLTVSEAALVDELSRMVRSGESVMLGVVRQEVLSGIRSAEKFEGLRRALRALDAPTLDVQDYELSAQAFTTCRRHGVSAGGVDMLICAVAIRRAWSVFSTGADFALYAKWLPLRRHQLGGRSAR